MYEDVDGAASENTYIQFRELVLSVHGCPTGANEYWHRWFLKYGGCPRWQPFLEKWNMTDCDWIPSLKMAQSWKWSMETMTTFGCEQEVLCSTKYMICQCLDWATRLRQPSCEKAHWALKDICCKVLSVDHHVLAGPAWAAPQAQQASCASGAEQVCKVCAVVLEEMTTAAGILVASVADLLIALQKRESSCPCLQGWLETLVDEVARLLNESFRSEHVWAATSKDAPAPRGQKRRMRLDSDLFGQSLRNMIANKKIKRASMTARCGVVDADVTSAKRAEENTMKKYLQTTRETFAHESIVRMATDESSVGGEATLVSCLWSPSLKRAAWLAPQVLQ